MKLAVMGKGGVGKTFIAGTLARSLARMGYSVLAVDADPAMNLAQALGIPEEEASKALPIAEDRELIEERTGVGPEGFGAVFSLTPRVDDIADRYCIEGPDGVKLLVMGTVKGVGSGCTCPANALLRALMSHLILRRTEAVVMDMEAGLEHLGRATAKGVDCAICVVEPCVRSVEIAHRIASSLSALGVRKAAIAANKVVDGEPRRLLDEALRSRGLFADFVIPYDEAVARAGMLGASPMDFAPNCAAVRAVVEMAERLAADLGGR